MHEEKPALDTTPRRIRLTAILASLLGGVIILGMKAWAAKLSDSSALRSDALEGTVNVLAAAFGLGSLLFAEKPADERHPYGHGKIEYFAQAFEGGLISLAGFLILIDTLFRIIRPHPMEQLGEGLKVNLIAGALNGLLGILLYSTGKKHQSKILMADGIHLFTDLVTTGVLAVGLGLVLLTGWTILDPILALGVAFFLFRTGFRLVQDSSNALLDAENPELTGTIVKYLNEIRRGSVITTHEMKAQQFGRDTHVDLHVVVPEYLSIKEAHDESDRFAQDLMQRLGNGSVVHTHIDPCERSYCRECSMKDCALRTQNFEAVKEFDRDSVIRPGPH